MLGETLQDWLVSQSEKLGILHTTVDAGRRWLLQMGEAASRFGLRLQYCMALPRHVLQSLEVPAVTQACIAGYNHTIAVGETVKYTCMFTGEVKH